MQEPALTQQFVRSLGEFQSSTLIFPTQRYPAYSSDRIFQFIRQSLGKKTSPLIFISFSAGVVGAIGAAYNWQLTGGDVAAFIALDGWGVPLLASFPLYRLSHDRFTHWSSHLLGGGQESFYADPLVSHLSLWGFPDTATGWHTRAQIGGIETSTSTTAADFLQTLLRRHWSSTTSL